MNNGYYTSEELKQFNFKSFGENVLISKKASLYMTENMSFGNNVRIDDFCTIIGNITFGSHIHIGSYTGIHATKGSVTFSDFVNISSKVTIYSVTDDFSGEYLTGAVISEEFTNAVYSDIFIGKHVIIGTGSTVLPKSIIGEGSAIGAMCLVKSELKEWTIFVGIPVRPIGERKKDLLELEGYVK